MAESIDDYFMVWGTDQAPYGPVELATLVAWVEDGRVTPETWIYVGRINSWLRARKLSELKVLFGSTGDTTRLSAPPQIDPHLLRRIRILAGLSDAQLETIARLVEPEHAPKGAMIVSQGQRGDNLYLILEGELRVSLPVQGREVTLTTLGTGDFFGDVALLNHGTRSADVVANTNCLLGRLSESALDAISRRDLEVARTLLQALDQALSERIRADNQRFAEVMASALLTK